jgi:hypothetical protein
MKRNKIMKKENYHRNQSDRRPVSGALFYYSLLIFIGVSLAYVTALATGPTSQKTFASPQDAGEALISAAEKYDEAALSEILGPDSYDILHSGEPARDKQNVLDFAAKARTKMNISSNPKLPGRQFLSVGDDDWPFPVPIVKRGGVWSFDTRAGREELLYRRIGGNELDAIDACRGYVVAQHEYALKKRDGYDVHQYAQRIVSTPGTQDGLAWQNADGTWGGAVTPEFAKLLDRDFRDRTQPFHGYFFKTLKGQGPNAPLGAMSFVVKDLMIGGFALVAYPAQYRVTGVKTFMVSYDGVVYEKDLGPKTSELAVEIELFNPDKTWQPVKDDE